ncbi:MAG: hypothetical protein NBV60_11070 [Erythrobacter sp.]|nr:hypothetical protein [Erythrobacter sp.]
MINLVALVLIAVMPNTAAPAAMIDSPSGVLSDQNAGLAEQPGDAVAGTQQASLDLAGAVPGTAAPAHGRPRVSQTRCAIIGCASQCEIKGTRDARGALVYRTPVSPLYSESTAEKIFCSRADAEAAGYRQPGQG